MNQIFYFQISSLWRMLAIIGVLVAISVYVNPQAWTHLALWEYCVFTLAILTLIVMFLLRKRFYIKLDDQSITIHYMTGHERRYQWRDITKVGILTFKRPLPTVALRLRDDSPALTAQNKMYRTVTGYDVALPSFFAPAEELAATIEEMRLRSGAPIS